MLFVLQFRWFCTPTLIKGKINITFSKYLMISTHERHIASLYCSRWLDFSKLKCIVYRILFMGCSGDLFVRSREGYFVVCVCVRRCCCFCFRNAKQQQRRKETPKWSSSEPQNCFICHNRTYIARTRKVIYNSLNIDIIYVNIRDLS